MADILVDSGAAFTLLSGEDLVSTGIRPGVKRRLRIADDCSKLIKKFEFPHLPIDKEYIIKEYIINKCK